MQISATRITRDADWHEPTPVEEVMLLAQALDNDLATIRRYREQADELAGHKIYEWGDDLQFDERTLAKRTAKTYFVQRLGYNQGCHCLPAKVFDREGEYMRHDGTACSHYVFGWKAKQLLHAKADTCREHYEQVLREYIPDEVRRARQSGEQVPHEAVETLRKHYKFTCPNCREACRRYDIIQCHRCGKSYCLRCALLWGNNDASILFLACCEEV